MASSKRRPDKRKRTRQNRQLREARQARSAHAGEATAISRERQEDTGSESDAAPSRGRARGEAAAEPSGRGRRKRSSIYTVPGQRAVVMAFLFTIVAAATLVFAPVQVERQVQPDDPRVEAEDPEVDDEGTVTIVEDVKLVDEEGPAVAAGVLLTPIAITGAAVWFTKRPQRSMAWTVALIALSAYIFLFAGPYGIITLPSLIALAVGGFQSRRAESKERLAQMRAERDEAGEDAGDAAGDEEPVEDDEDAPQREMGKDN